MVPPTDLQSTHMTPIAHFIPFSNVVECFPRWHWNLLQCFTYLAIIDFNRRLEGFVFYILLLLSTWCILKEFISVLELLNHCCTVPSFTTVLVKAWHIFSLTSCSIQIHITLFGFSLTSMLLWRRQPAGCTRSTRQHMTINMSGCLWMKNVESACSSTSQKSDRALFVAFRM